MSSPERELLKRLLTSGIFESGLYADWKQYIKELLAQPERKPLSDERLRDLSNSIHTHPDFDNVSVWQVFYIARAIEKAHGIY